jgi:hypothetical protein
MGCPKEEPARSAYMMGMWAGMENAAQSLREAAEALTGGTKESEIVKVVMAGNADALTEAASRLRARAERGEFDEEMP